MANPNALAYYYTVLSTFGLIFNPFWITVEPRVKFLQGKYPRLFISGFHNVVFYKSLSYFIGLVIDQYGSSDLQSWEYLISPFLSIILVLIIGLLYVKFFKGKLTQSSPTLLQNEGFEN